MNKIYRASALLLIGSMLLSGCSMLTAQGRRERAYERYVQKSSHGRLKQQKLFAKRGQNMPITYPDEPMMPTEPMMTTESVGPESFGEGGQQ